LPKGWEWFCCLLSSLFLKELLDFVYPRRFENVLYPSVRYIYLPGWLEIDSSPLLLSSRYFLINLIYLINELLEFLSDSLDKGG